MNFSESRRRRHFPGIVCWNRRAATKDRGRTRGKVRQRESRHAARTGNALRMTSLAANKYLRSSSLAIDSPSELLSVEIMSIRFRVPAID